MTQPENAIAEFDSKALAGFLPEAARKFCDKDQLNSVLNDFLKSHTGTEAVSKLKSDIGKAVGKVFSRMIASSTYMEPAPKLQILSNELIRGAIPEERRSLVNNDFLRAAAGYVETDSEVSQSLQALKGHMVKHVTDNFVRRLDVA